jgi:hypothetical protein
MACRSLRAGFGWKLENSGPGLNECSQKNRDKFFWISHTYTHQQLDWLGPCSPAGVNCTPTPPDKVAWEVEMNVALINGSLDGSMFVDDPQGLQYVALSGFWSSVSEQCCSDESGRRANVPAHLVSHCLGETS